MAVLPVISRGKKVIEDVLVPALRDVCLEELLSLDLTETDSANATVVEQEGCLVGLRRVRPARCDNETEMEETASALSYGLAVRLMLRVMPPVVDRRAKAAAAYCTPRSLWWSRPGGGGWR